MGTHWLLFGHLAGAFVFVGCSAIAVALRLAAMRRDRPSEIALLLRTVRPVVPLVAGGLVLTVAMGLWLADRLGYNLGSTWLVATFVLVGWLLVVGAVAGRQDRRTRELADRLAAQGDRPSAELARRLRDPLNLALSASMVGATVAIVALMVWKPGA